MTRRSLPLVFAGFAVAATVLLAQGVLAQEASARLPQGGTADWLDALLHWTTRSIEIAGIAVIVIGALAATAVYLWRALTDGFTQETFHNFRAGLGRAILLGLEFLVAADIIATVAIEPTLNSVAVLAGIVLIRTFLSFALEVEIEGHWPWQKRHRQHELP